MSNNTVTKEERVYQLVQELEEMKKKKKATAKSFNAECKRLQSEINDLLEEDVEEEQEETE